MATLELAVGSCVTGPVVAAAELFVPDFAAVAFFVAAAVAFALAFGGALSVATAVEDDEAGATSAVPELTPADAPEMLNALLAPN